MNIIRNKFSFIGRVLALLGLFSLSSHADEIPEMVTLILEEAIQKKQLWILEGNAQSHKRRFFPFRYYIPDRIWKDLDSRQIFIECMKDAIAENRVVGPHGRPLTLVPMAKKRGKDLFKPVGTFSKSHQPDKYGSDQAY